MNLKTIISGLFIDNPWMALVIFGVAIIGFIFTIYFGLRSLKKKWPVVDTKSNNLIDNFTSEYNGLKIKLNDQDCETITSTKLVFWNKGRETILGTDIPTLDKLTIKAKEGVKIFNALVIKKSDEANNFRIHSTTAFLEIFMDFEYLDKNDGAVIQIIHSGKKSDDLLISGSIMGFGKIQNTKIPMYFAGLHNAITFVVNTFYKIIFYFKGGKEIDLKEMKHRHERIIIAIFSFSLPIIAAVSIFIPYKPLPIGYEVFLSGIAFILYYPMGFYLLKRRIPKKLGVL